MSLTADERFSIIPEWLLRSGVSAGALRLYAELGMFADYTTGVASPGRKLLGDRMGVSLDTVDRLKSELVKASALTVTKRKDGRGNDTNLYVVHRLPPRLRDRADAATPPRTPSRTVAARTRETPNEIELSPSERECVSLVRSAWESGSVIAHREAYFEDGKTKRAIHAALRIYPVEAIVEAIKNYATVVNGAEYRWSHRWTLVDFLKRGLDKFVAEADPLRNYRDSKAPAPKEEGGRSYDL